MRPPAERPPVLNTARALAVRPGLVLGWSETAWPDEPEGTAAAFLYHLEEGAGRMSVSRKGLACTCAAAGTGFRAAVFLSGEAIAATFGQDPGAGATALRRFAAGEPAAFEHPLTPRARLALDSIRRCPFAGACRDMALTARCHDLLVEFLTAWTASLQPTPATTVGPDARVRLAAEVLERDLGAPPSLADLAAQVGLSETTLKRSFPQVHGTTVFGYIRARRMEEARRRLESGAATVLEAAAHVGYSNPSNFAAAFRAQFGVNPKTFQLRARRSG